MIKRNSTCSLSLWFVYSHHHPFVEVLFVLMKLLPMWLPCNSINFDEFGYLFKAANWNDQFDDWFFELYQRDYSLNFDVQLFHVKFFLFIFSETKKRRKDPSESTTEEDNGAPECKGKRKNPISTKVNIIETQYAI